MEIAPSSTSQMALSVGLPVNRYENCEPMDSEATTPSVRATTPTIRQTMKMLLFRPEPSVEVDIRLPSDLR